MATSGTDPRPDRWRFYRAVWRWHFYAGLLVLPVIAWLALTGAAYLYKAPLDRVFHHHLKVVEVGRERVPPQRLREAATRAVPGEVFRYTTPVAADASAEVAVMTADARHEVVYVDPYTATVLGHLPDRGTLAGVIRRLHSLDLLGPLASGVVELAAGWAIVLVLTGVYLWWPRRRAEPNAPRRAQAPVRRRGLDGVLIVRGHPRQRLFWRDLHAVTGVLVGGVLLFLALTGMPWSVLWGAKVNQWVNGHDFGYPRGLRVEVPMSTQRLSQTTTPAWSLRQARLPASTPPDPHAGHAGHEMSGVGAMPDPAHGAIGLDAALARFDALGLAPGYSVSLPVGARGVYTASIYPADLHAQRVVHLDQYSGQVLLDMGFDAYGPAARALEWGINVHLGQEYGATNQVVLLLACAGIVLLCVSGVVMWWKRRPQRQWGVPPMPVERGTLRVVFGLLLVFGLLFPLVGVSLLLIAALDRGWVRDNGRATR
jgi:uncharacterized iron-regulated membrane protein